ncbi:MAG: hypothetical protein IT375_04270 [Polyangiaceae bacterium]|nr:hypothetical protein [Polyangiaceae bacterium]
MRSIPWLPLVLALGACQRAPRCDGEPDDRDLERMRDLIESGKEPCPEHLRPQIVLDRSGLTLNGKRLMAREAIAPGRIAPLFSALKQNRETWKMTHPGRSFDARPKLSIDPETETWLAASVMASTAFAGYPDQQLRVGQLDLFVPYAVPGPPQPDAPPAVALHLERRESGALGARFLVAKIVRESSPDLEGFAPLAEWVASRCVATPQPCASAIVLSVRGPFIGTLELLRAVQARAPLSGVAVKFG